MDVKDRLDPKKNPFFEHAEGTVFTAYEGRKCVGRITAQIDQEHLERHKDQTGFFGFLDTIDDPEVARALLDAGRVVATAARHEEGARTVLALHQRGERLPRRGLRRSAGPHEPASSLLPGRRSSSRRATRRRRTSSAGATRSAISTRASARRATTSARCPRSSSRPLSKKDLERDVEDHARHLQRRLERELGLRPDDEEGGRQDVRRPQALPRPRDHAHRHHRRRAGGRRARDAQRQRAHPRSARKALSARDRRSCSTASRCEGAKSGRLLILGIKKKFRLQRKYAGLSLVPLRRDERRRPEVPA